MSFQGSLDTVGLRDVFQLFAFSRKSGALHLRAERHEGIVYFADGEVYYATATPNESVGSLLVKAGLVESEVWKKVLSTTSEGQGKVLVAEASVDRGGVEAFVQERVEDAIFKLVQWDEGDFELVDEEHGLGPVFRFGCDPLLDEASRRLKVWEKIKATIPSTSMGVRLRRDLPAEVEQVTLSRSEWRLIGSLTSGTSIDDLAAALGETEFRTAQALHALIERDIVELMSEEKIAALRDFFGSETDESSSADSVVEDGSGADADDAEMARLEVAALDAGLDSGAADSVVAEDGHGSDESPDAVDVEAAGAVSEASPEEPAAEPAEVPVEAAVEVTTNASLADMAALADGDAADAGHSRAAAPEHGVSGSTAPEISEADAAAAADLESFSPDAAIPGSPLVAQVEPIQPVQPVIPTEGAAAPGNDASGSADAEAIEAGGDGDMADLDKSTIMRLIAGVRSI